MPSFCDDLLYYSGLLTESNDALKFLSIAGRISNSITCIFLTASLYYDPIYVNHVTAKLRSHVLVQKVH